MSIFDLKTQTSELQLGNGGVSRAQYEMIAPSRDVSNLSFPNGPISFKFQNSSTKWWVPSKSYLRTRLTFTKGDGTALTFSGVNAVGANTGDDVVPSMNVTSNLFQSMEFRIQDKVVSRCSDYVNVIDTLVTRQTKSSSWFNSFGAASNMWEIAKEDKYAKLYANPSFDTIWTPACLSIFNVEHAIAGGCNFELVLNPNNLATYQTLCVESRAAKGPYASAAAQGDFKVVVEEMYLYIHTVEAERIENMSYLLDLQTSRLQTEGLTNTNANFTQKTFDISPSTYAVTTFYQDNRGATNTTIGANKFLTDTNGQNKLNRYYLNYASQSIPSPDYDLKEQYLTLPYTNTIINNGKYLSNEGVETLKDFLARGMYLSFLIARDGSDRSTKLSVNASFTGAPNLANARLCVCDQYRQIARIVIKDGRCIDVQLEDA